MLLDAVVLAEHLQDGQQGDVLSVRDTVSLEDANVFRPAVLQKLEAQTALAGAGLRHDAYHLSVAVLRLLERGLERAHVAVAPDELREPALARHVEARLQGGHALQLVDGNQLGYALHAERAEVFELEVARGQGGGVTRHVDRVWRSELLHAGRQAHRVTLSRVVHAQVIADLSDDDLARVESDARRKIESVFALDLARVLGESLAKLQSRVAGALGVVLVRDRCAEERHDAVARVLVDRSLEAVHVVREDLEEAVEDAVPRLRVELLGELHRTLHIREEHGHLLTFALECAAAGQDPLRQVLWGVGGEVALGCCGLRRDGGVRTVILLLAINPREYPTTLVDRHLLNVDQLFLQFLERLVVELELPAQDAVGDAPILLEKAPDLADDFE